MTINCMNEIIVKITLLKGIAKSGQTGLILSSKYIIGSLGTASIAPTDLANTNSINTYYYTNKWWFNSNIIKDNDN